MDTKTDRLIRAPELKALVGLSDVHIQRLEAAGKFPRRIKLIPGSGRQGAVAWSFREVVDWIETRKINRVAQ